MAKLLEPNPVYKPFSYPWAYECWHKQQQLHWLPEEVPMADDIKDWRGKLTETERNLLTQIFRFFTQADVEVNNCYMKNYARVFQPTEIQMMLAAFCRPSMTSSFWILRNISGSPVVVAGPVSRCGTGITYENELEFQVTSQCTAWEPKEQPKGGARSFGPS